MFKKWFKRNDTPDEFKLEDIKIYNLRIGDLFDYDLTTWEVVTIGQCDYDGHVECEWEVRGGGRWNYPSQRCPQHSYLLVDEV